MLKKRDFCLEFRRTKKRKPRHLSGYRKRKPKGLRAEKPGDLVQIDHAEIQHLPGRKYYHFSAQDEVTRICAFGIYSSASSLNAADMLVQKKFPFPIKGVQVDGGSEFMAKFESKCEKDGVKLYVIPPKSPKYNGKVERLQRSCKFYSRYEGTNLKEIREELDEQMYNRPHMGRGN